MSFWSSVKLWSLQLWIRSDDSKSVAPSSPTWLPCRSNLCKQLRFRIAAARDLHPLLWIKFLLKSSSWRVQFKLHKFCERISTPSSSIWLRLRLNCFTLHAGESNVPAKFRTPSFVMLFPARPRTVIWFDEKVKSSAQCVSPASNNLQKLSSRRLILQLAVIKQGSITFNPTPSTALPLKSSSSRFVKEWKKEARDLIPAMVMLFHAKLILLWRIDSKLATPLSPMLFKPRFTFESLVFSFRRVVASCATPSLQMSLPLRFSSSMEVFKLRAEESDETPTLVIQFSATFRIFNLHSFLLRASVISFIPWSPSMFALTLNSSVGPFPGSSSFCVNCRMPITPTLLSDKSMPLIDAKGEAPSTFARAEHSGTPMSQHGNSTKGINLLATSR